MNNLKYLGLVPIIIVALVVIKGSIVDKKFGEVVAVYIMLFVTASIVIVGLLWAFS